jgi:Tfp pilus assembly protein PilV
MTHEQSRLPHQVKSSRRNVARAEHGFTLIELTIATLLLMIALAALAQLAAVTIVQHSDGRRRNDSTRQAQAKLDELMKMNQTTAPAVQITGTDSLAANVANYFDSPAPGITRRWVVTAGPVADTRTVTIRVINQNIAGGDRGSYRQVDLTSVLRQW